MIDSKTIIETALHRGCDFAEVFIENSSKLSLILQKDRKLKASIDNESGIGIRVIKNGEMRYGYSPITGLSDLLRLTETLSKNQKHECISTQNFTYESSLLENVKINSSTRHYEAVLEYLNLCQEYADYNKIQNLSCNHYDETRHIQIVNSEGLDVSHKLEKTRLLVRATAEVDGIRKTCYSGPAISGGIELYNNLDLKHLVEDVSKSACIMAGAKPIQSGRMSVVIDNGFGGLFFHEACGHSLEAKSIACNESEFSGRLGQQVASEKVTLIDDGSIEGAWGTQAYDDEGTKTSRNVLIENGVLKSFLIDSRSGQQMNMKTTGSCRRESYKFPPTSRMSNTYLKPGSDVVEDIVSNTEQGLFVKSIDAGSVNPVTGAFNFTILEGYEISKGKVKRPVSGATLVGTGSEAIMNVDMVGSDLHMGQGFCYDKSGALFIEAGQPTIRIKEMTVGGLG